MRGKLRLLAGIVSASVLPGCAGNSGAANLFPTIPDLMAARQWEGQPLQEAIRAFGEPADIVKDEQNQSVARWRYIKTWTSSTSINSVSAGPGPGGVTITPNSVQQTRSSECRLELTYDAHKIITNFKTWKSSVGVCNDYSFSRPG